MDYENGGFYGFVTNDLKIDKQSDKGCILNSRILWTYSTAYMIYKDEKYLNAAKHAYEFMKNYFWDKKYGGLYFSLDYKGNVINDRKQIYNMAFGIYGLSQYYRATDEKESIERAKMLFECIEKKAYDNVNKGYFEAYSRDFKPVDDLRLSDKDLNEKKSMNTHLHLLEAYSNLLRVWDNKFLRSRLKEIMDITLNHIIDPLSYHFKLFFNEYWESKSETVSFGHDIEGSWLLCEAVELLGDKELIKKVRDIALKMAQAVYEKGIDNTYGGVFYESEKGELTDKNKVWWTQAEAMVGFINAYQLTKNEKYLDVALNTWKFIKNYIIDNKYGEWFWSVSYNGELYEEHCKVGPWKCPYHNSRACFEIIERQRTL